MNLSLLIVVFLTVFDQSVGDLSDFFTKSEKFFSIYVTNGRVNYSQLKKNSLEINDLMTAIQRAQVDHLNAGAKKAFYINAYNLTVIHSIVRHYPVKSPMDIDGFFDKQKHNIAGESLTLNELEQSKLIKTYQAALSWRRSPRVCSWPSGDCTPCS